MSTLMEYLSGNICTGIYVRNICLEYLSWNISLGIYVRNLSPEYMSGMVSWNICPGILVREFFFGIAVRVPKFLTPPREIVKILVNPHSQIAKNWDPHAHVC